MNGFYSPLSIVVQLSFFVLAVSFDKRIRSGLLDLIQNRAVLDIQQELAPLSASEREIAYEKLRPVIDVRDHSIFSYILFLMFNNPLIFILNLMEFSHNIIAFML